MKKYISSIDTKNNQCTLVKEFIVGEDGCTLWKTNDGKYVVRFEEKKDLDTVELYESLEKILD